MALELDVKYRNGSPHEIVFHHNTAGMMKFHLSDGVAQLDPDWDKLHWRDLKDRYEPWIQTEDVIREVRSLPFIESVQEADTIESK